METLSGGEDHFGDYGSQTIAIYLDIEAAIITPGSLDVVSGIIPFGTPVSSRGRGYSTGRSFEAIYTHSGTILVSPGA